jgi:hypothetical protein
MPAEPTIPTELQQLGVQALKDLYANLTQAKGFVLDQAPDFLRQVINWQIAQGVLSIIAAAVAVGVFIYVFRWLRKNIDSEKAGGDGTASVMFAIFGGAGALCACIFAMVQVFQAVKALVTPKLFLVEYLTQLVK